MAVEIRGYSDGIVSIEGDGFSDEFYPSGEDGFYLALSDGSMFSVRYDDGGFWRIVCLARGASEIVKVEATNPDDNYSDVVTVKGRIEWVLGGSDLTRRAVRP